MTTSEQPERRRHRARPHRVDQRDPRLVLAELFDPVVAVHLWESLPPECRSDHFDKATMPERYRGAVMPATAGGAKRTTLYLNMRGLPKATTFELAWIVHRHIELGRTLHPTSFNAATRVLRAAVANGGRRARTAPSLMALTPEQWVREGHAARLKGTALGPSNDEYAGQALKRWQDLLTYACHRGGWWRLDVWNPTLDSRIPLRPHEPSGRTIVNFSRLHTDWLRDAGKFWLSNQLETGQLSWTTVTSRVHYLDWLQRRIDVEGDV